MNADPYKWSFFIAHAGADRDAAEALYERLAPHAPTFLDFKCIQLGEDWDLALARAQKEALISVVLVSVHSERAYYQREEIAASIDLARNERKKHRVVPVFLDAEAASSTDVPYGLRLKHGLRLTDDFGLDKAAEALLDLLRRVGETPKEPVDAGEQFSPPPRRPRTRWLAGAVMSAIVVLGVTVGWFWPRDESPSPAKQSVSAENCIMVDYLSPNVIPHYLLNSIGSENFPYWLRIVAQNECSEDRIMTLRFERSDNVVLQNPPQSHNFTVRKGDTETRTFNPRFDLAKEQPDNITFHWSVEDERQTRVRADSIRIEIVPRLTVAWDLQKPVAPKQRTPVEKEFLLGSLKAWILKPPLKVADLARACRTTPASKVMLEREDAIRACYRHLFTGDRAVSVSESPIGFPSALSNPYGGWQLGKPGVQPGLETCRPPPCGEGRYAALKWPIGYLSSK